MMFMAACGYFVTIAIVCVVICNGQECDDVKTDAVFYDIYKGKQTDLDCSLNINGGESISWFYTPKDSNVTSPYPFSFCQKDNCLLINKNRTLKIIETDTNASGVFTCFAACSNSGIKKWKLIVHDACSPDITPTISGDDIIVARTGNNVALHCKADYHCEYFLRFDYGIDWKWNGKKLENGTAGVLISTHSSKDGLVYDSTLLISEVKEKTFKFPFVCSPLDEFSMETANNSIFLKEETSTESKSIVGISVSVGVIFAVVISIVIAGTVCRTQLRMKMRQMSKKFFRTYGRYRESVTKEFDVFLHHDDNHNDEVDDINNFLCNKGFKVQCGRPVGTPHFAARELIENSRSVVCISSGDDILQSILTEATEEIRSRIVLIYPKSSERISTGTLNTVCLKYTYPDVRCYSWKRKKFLTELLLALPDPRTPHMERDRHHTTDRQTSTIALIRTQQSVISQGSEYARV